MDDDNGGWLVTAVLLFMTIGAFFVARTMYEAFDAEIARIKLNREVCEGNKGVFLDRTYQAGKVTNHNYTCIKKDSIIELEKQDGTR